MTEILKHARVTTRTPQPDGSMVIETKSYYEDLNSVHEEIQQSVKTSKETFIADLMRCCALISDGTTPKLLIEIEANTQHEPTRIIKTWTVRKEYYGKRPN